MAARFVSRDGTTVVKEVRRECTGTGRDGTWLQVHRHGFLVGEVRNDARNMGELAKLCDVTDLKAV